MTEVSSNTNIGRTEKVWWNLKCIWVWIMCRAIKEAAYKALKLDYTAFLCYSVWKQWTLSFPTRACPGIEKPNQKKKNQSGERFVLVWFVRFFNFWYLEFLVQKAPAFLNNCLVEECTKANSGTCKKTGHKFEKVWYFVSLAVPLFTIPLWPVAWWTSPSKHFRIDSNFFLYCLFCPCLITIWISLWLQPLTLVIEFLHKRTRIHKMTLLHGVIGPVRSLVDLIQGRIWGFGKSYSLSSYLSVVNGSQICRGRPDLCTQPELQNFSSRFQHWKKSSNQLWM